MPKLNNTINVIRRQPRWRLVLAALVVVVLGGWWWKGGGKSDSKILTFAARRGPLEITVLEGGSLQALESQEIKCEVRGAYQGTKILRIVEEGYLVTEEDVRTNKVLCELDSAELQKLIVQDEIQYQSALASLTDAEQNYEIQLGDAMSFDQKVTDLRARMEVSRYLHEMPKPTLAVIPGAAAGAGLSIALACDLRIAADNAKLTTAFSKIGLSGDFGGSYFLQHLVGAAKARELYFTGRVVLADEALKMGMLNRVVPAAQLADAARAWAAELAALPTVALGYMKRNLNAGLRMSLADVLDIEAIHMMRTFETDDHKGAAAAFVEKRAPQFNGR